MSGKAKDKIFLIGFMGSGKSQTARVLGSMLNLPIFDTDQMIEKAAGKSIAEIFREDGEETFREYETCTLSDFVDFGPCIVSCGGGMPLRNENRRLMKEAGIVILLTASAEIIMERVKNDVQRPLLQNKINLEYISGMMEQRKRFYKEAAHMTINTEGKSLEEVGREIGELLQREKATVKIGNLLLGDGYPKICIPLVGSDRDQILREIEALKAARGDLAEWRADHFHGVEDNESVREMLKLIRKKLSGIPLLFTFRTVNEGGKTPFSDMEYKNLLDFVIGERCVDAVDIEAYRGEDIVVPLIVAAHENGVKVIGSFHDFEKTPAKEEIVNRLLKMYDIGADVAKIAVMPQREEDVLILMESSLEMKKNQEKRPFVTISMGETGLISRYAAAFSGSAFTFGAGLESSAPGQADAEILKKIIVHIDKII